MANPNAGMVESILKKDGVRLDRPAIVGIRGYMAKPGSNKRNVYDDRIFVWAPDGHKTDVYEFKANTDPSVTRKGVAVLKPGVWKYRKGKHKINSPKGYPALVQAAPVTVRRDHVGDDTGWFGINIHKGSMYGTSSLGCQTIYPSKWEEFRDLVYSGMGHWNMDEISYVLVEK